MQSKAKLEAYGVVYKVENLINGKIYVGQTVQELRARWQRHCRASGSGCAALSNAIRKYGANSFELSVVATASCSSELDFLEIAFIRMFESIAPNGYNLKSGGAKGRHSATSKSKMSEAHRASNTLNKHRSSLLTRWDNDAYRKNMSERAKARWRDKAYIEKTVSAMRKSAASDDTKYKKREARNRYLQSGGLEKLISSQNTPSALKKKSDNAIAYWSDEKNRSSYGEKMKAKWADDQYRARAVESAKTAFTEERKIALQSGALRYLNDVDSKARSDSKSGVRGVRWHKASKKWQARVTIPGVGLKHLGNFDTPEQAQNAYRRAKQEILDGLAGLRDLALDQLHRRVLVCLEQE